jgi:hypothetical protein
MGLFVDGDLSTAEDLRKYESSILDVASSEGIALDAKIELAQRELVVQLQAFLAQRRSSTGTFGLRNVLVTEALSQWHTLLCLAAIYRDAYNSQLNDRYGGKWREYVRLAERSASLALDIGLGMTSDPLPRPAVPACSIIAGGSGQAHTLFLEIAWVDVKGYRSSKSQQIAFSAGEGEWIRVEPVDAPVNATGFHVYAGLTPDTATRQTASALAMSEVWTEPSSGLHSMLTDVLQQQPDFVVERIRSWSRG